MGRHARVLELRAQLKSAGGDISGRHVRSSWSLPLFSTFVSFAFLAVILAPPNEGSAAFAAIGQSTFVGTQSVASGAGGGQQAVRDSFGVTLPVTVAPAPAASASRASSGAPAAGAPDPGSAQAVAQGMLAARGLGDAEYSCLVALWGRESGWNVFAYNSSSGAYGIPQALPGEKMASAGSDWATSASTQIAWGLSYIEGRYGTPCGAWAHSESSGWY